MPAGLGDRRHSASVGCSVPCVEQTYRRLSVLWRGQVKGFELIRASVQGAGPPMAEHAEPTCSKRLASLEGGRPEDPGQPQCRDHSADAQLREQSHTFNSKYQSFVGETAPRLNVSHRRYQVTVTLRETSLAGGGRSHPARGWLCPPATNYQGTWSL